jgi:pentatricopeptide repeat protein
MFDKMSHKNVVSLNAMIVAYTQHGHGKDALILFNWMQQSNMTPNSLYAAYCYHNSKHTYICQFVSPQRFGNG